MERLFESLKNKKILIAGFGKEGKSTYKLLRKYFSDKVIGIADRNSGVKELISDDNNVRFHLGTEYLQSIKQYDLIFKSPGISLKDYPCSNREKITSQTDIFMEIFGQQTIGVTGTKGKSTTSSLIAHILKESGKEQVLLGNIGIPAFDKISEIKKNTIVVFELSAHQLEYLHHSPKVAVLLNIFPEHLDHFGNLAAYKNAKLNIAKFQNNEDILVTSKSLENCFAKTKSKISYYEGSMKISPGRVQLKGSHNINNVRAAILSVEPFGISREKALLAASGFKPLPHRMEYVGKFGGINFYNDSISTIPESSIAAIKAIGSIDTLILGGFDRGLDFSGLINFLLTEPIKSIIFTGPAGKKIYEMFLNRASKNTKLFLADGIEDAFKIIRKHTTKGGKCLLSPAAASYDRYNNFEHRGDIFKALAQKMDSIRVQ